MKSNRSKIPGALIGIAVLALVAFAVMGVARAAVSLAESTTVTLLRGTTTVGTFPSWDACRAQALQLANASTATSGTVTYSCQTEKRKVTATYSANPPPPVCGPQPSPESQTVQCPTGTSGTWQQTRTYSQAPAPVCWSAGNWTPLAPAAGECPANPPPPAGRPLLFAADQARLAASIAAGQPEATSYINLMRAAAANRGSYDDISTFQIAFAGWIANDATMLNVAKAESLAYVRSRPGGISGHGDDFQHSEEVMLNVAAVADLAFSRYSVSELAEVATWVNGTCANWMTANRTYWPFDDPLNNYWQNGFLAMVVAAVGTDGFNPNAAALNAEAARMAAKFATEATPPKWNGLVQAEGHYYSTYVRHALWAMTLHDGARGTTWFAQSGVDPAATLDALIYQARPHWTHFFLVGSEAADASASFGPTSLAYWSQLATLAPASQQAGHAKTILATAEAANYWYRASKAFQNFYFNTRAITALPLSSKADRLNVQGTPGAGLIGVRSGFDPQARAALMFANSMAYDARWSHGNPDAPGFQWASGPDWLVTDPEFYGSSGIMAEAGSGVGSDVSNIVTLTGAKSNDDEDPQAGFPLIRFAQDNRSASVPHFYVQIDAQPYWNQQALAVPVYRREYVWLDDLQVVVVRDQVTANAAKVWRLHVPAAPTISGSTAAYTINGKAVTVRDLTGGSWSSANLRGTLQISRDVWRLSQALPAGAVHSIKVLDVGGRVSAANVSGNVVTVTINGTTRTITFGAVGEQATVQ